MDIQLKSKRITIYEYLWNDEYLFKIIPFKEETTANLMVRLYKNDSGIYTIVTNIYCSSLDECRAHIHRYIERFKKESRKKRNRNDIRL